MVRRAFHLGLPGRCAPSSKLYCWEQWQELIAGGMIADLAETEIDSRLPVKTDDALRQSGSIRYRVVLTNPPFGKKSSIMVVSG